MGVSLRRSPVGEPGEGVCLQGTVRDSGRRALEMEHLSLRVLCYWEPGGIKEGSEDGHPFPWGPCWETWKRTHMPGAYVWKKVLGWLSVCIGALWGNLGRGSVYWEL
jgi:hypothetical protein